MSQYRVVAEVIDNSEDDLIYADLIFDSETAAVEWMNGEDGDLFVQSLDDLLVEDVYVESIKP